MGDRRPRKSGEALASRQDDSRLQTDMSERALGRAVAGGLPAVAVVLAVTVGVTVGLGPALLILAAGAILGTISLLWASIRTLSGDAPLAESFSTLGGTATVSGGAGERKRAALRALKDLEFEHSVGKIDDTDYAEMVARYRGEAKALMREMDVEIEPLRVRAEEVARRFLVKKGLAGDAEVSSEPDVAADSPSEPETVDPGETAEPPRAARTAARVDCPKCSTSNEHDADFCKKCGKALRRECRECQTLNEHDADFCKKCGKALSETEKDRADVPT
jgi:ribosomal protein L40E